VRWVLSPPWREWATLWTVNGDRTTDSCSRVPFGWFLSSIGNLASERTQVPCQPAGLQMGQLLG
jgi:hypothetical protein